VRVAVADDSALFREGLARLLTDAGAEVTVQARTGVELLARIADAPPDVVVLDIRMPPTFTDEGLATAETVRDRHPGVAVLVLSTYAESAYAVRLLEHGAAGVGYLLKDRVDSARTLTRRGRSALDELTPREKLVLSLMAEGRSTIGIGTELGVSVKTVETQIASIFNRLDLPATVDTNRRVLAVLTWLREQPRTPG
jgi:DNA-binding NarL/FixJ family response regulator